MRRIAVGVVLSGCLLGAPAQAAGAAPILPPEKERWIRAQTAHFTLFSNASERRVLDLGKRLERFRAVLSQFYRKFRVDPAGPTFIYVFKSDASLTPYKRRFNGRPVEMSGYFVGRPDGNYIAMDGDPGVDPLDVIYHEYIHNFLGNNLHAVPLWFSEGVAECYATFQADEQSASIGRVQNDHILLLRDRPLIPLPELFAMTHESPEYSEGDRRGIFYAQSWALVHYLMFDRPERRPQLGQFLDRLARGEGAGPAFTASFQATFDQMEDELRAHVRQARFLFTAVKHAELPVDTATKVTPLSREDALARLGELLAQAHPDRAADAEALFQEALRRQPSHASARAGLGLLREQAGGTDEAVALYEQALAIDPRDALTAFRIGRCLARRARERPGPDTAEGASADRTRAQEMLGRTIQILPDFAEAYVEYARTIVEADGNLSSAIHLLEAARRLLPARPDVVTNLAILCARKGDRDRARDLIDNVLAHMNDPESLRQARAALEPVRGAAADAAPPPPAVAPPAGDAPGGDAPGAPDSVEPLAATAEEYNRQVAVYNRAVELANKSDYQAAIEILERLLPEVRAADLRGHVTKLLDSLRRDAARRPKSGG